MFHDSLTDWRARVGDDLLARSPEEVAPPPASPATTQPLSHRTIRTYLTALGLDDVDPVRERITCWDSLHAFVATRIAAKSDVPPNNNTRLKVYGLEKSRVMTMFLRHVVS